MEYDVVIGLDVGKSTHHAVCLDPGGKRLIDREVSNTEVELRELFIQATCHGEVLVVVDQLHSIGALPVTVAQAMEIKVAYLPGLSMRRLADLYPGNAKTDARDAFIIANAAWTAPHTLRRITVPSDEQANLSMLLGYDDDLAGFDQQVEHRSVSDVLPQRFLQTRVDLDQQATHPVDGRGDLTGGPQGLLTMGKTRIDTQLRKHAPRIHGRLTEQIWTALNEQTVIVPGTAAAHKVLPAIATLLLQLGDQGKQIARDVEEVLDAHPLAQILTSMPGVGVKIAARLLGEIGGDVTAFPTAAHLAAYAGISPVTRRSGTSIRGERVNRGGNKRLKNAMFMAAFASLRADPTSRAYYDRKRAEGKRHNAALICLARRKIDVLYAMIRDQRPYTSATPIAA